MDDVKTEVVSPDDIKMKKRKRFHLEDDVTIISRIVFTQVIGRFMCMR